MSFSALLCAQSSVRHWDTTTVDEILIDRMYLNALESQSGHWGHRIKSIAR